MSNQQLTIKDQSHTTVQDQLNHEVIQLEEGYGSRSDRSNAEHYVAGICNANPPSATELIRNIPNEFAKIHKKCTIRANLHESAAEHYLYRLYVYGIVGMIITSLTASLNLIYTDKTLAYTYITSGLLYITTIIGGLSMTHTPLSNNHKTKHKQYLTLATKIKKLILTNGVNNESLVNILDELEEVESAIDVPIPLYIKKKYKNIDPTCKRKESLKLLINNIN
jgi:hypothetical protein